MAGGRAVVVDPEWIRLLAQAKEWSRRTQGAFDPVLMALLKAWGLREGGLAPTTIDQAEARRASGATLLELDPVDSTLRLGSPQAGLEEGAFLKGYALDAVRRKAITQGAQIAGPISAGGYRPGGSRKKWISPIRFRGRRRGLRCCCPMQA